VSQDFEPQEDYELENNPHFAGKIEDQYVDDNIDGNLGQEGDGLEDDEEGESVYMIEGEVMQKIQIEGEPDQYLMDRNGNIYDMNAKFIGTYPNN
jgi:hypothetical protein